MFGMRAMWDFSRQFAGVGKAVEQVCESLGVHEAMLDSGLQHFEQLRMAFAGMFQRPFNRAVELIAQAGFVAVHFPAGGPVEWAVRGEAAADGINSKCKKLIERWIK